MSFFSTNEVGGYCTPAKAQLLHIVYPCTFMLLLKYISVVGQATLGQLQSIQSTILDLNDGQKQLPKEKILKTGQVNGAASEHTLSLPLADDLEQPPGLEIAVRPSYLMAANKV